MIAAPTFALDQANAAHRGPTLAVRQRAQLLGDPVPAHFQTPVVFVHLFGVVVRDTGEVARDRGGEEFAHLLLTPSPGCP